VKQFTLIFILLFTSTLSAQRVSSTIQISVDTLEVGEIDTAIFTIIAPSRSAIKYIDFEILDTVRPFATFFAKNDSTPADLDIADIEWIGQNTKEKYVPNSKEFTKEKGKTVFRKKILFRIWDIGVFDLPALDVEIDSTKATEVLSMQSSRVFVLPPKGIQPIDTSQILMPLVDILEEGTSWRDYIWMGYLLGGLLIIVLLSYLYARHVKKKNSVEETIIEIKRPAHEIALDKLHQLDEKKLWQDGNVKEYQSELTYIIREYLEDRYEIQALESTTGEILNDLKEQSFDTKHSDKLTKILQIADLVKFAKAKPGAELHQEFMDDAYSFVRETKQIKQIEEDGLAE